MTQYRGVYVSSSTMVAMAKEAGTHRQSTSAFGTQLVTRGQACEELVGVGEASRRWRPIFARLVWHRGL